MSKRAKLIDFIQKTKITDVAEITLDNLDSAELVEGENGVCVENEHGSQFSLEELSDIELEAFANEVGLESRYDYVIMNNNNRWLSSGFFATESDIQEEFDDFVKEAKSEYEVILIKSPEFTIITK